MKSTCHQCGREYLTARNLAGKPVACRSCGALNDGAGGPPPAPPPKSAESPRPRATGGASFTIGGGLPKVDPRALERELQAAEAAVGSVPNVRGVSMMNRTVLALGLGAVVLACVMVGALFVVRYIEQNPAGSRDWSGEMLATPQLLGEDGTGSGFLIEHEGKLWIVTNFHVIEGNEELDVVFPDPETGKEIFRIADQQVAKFRLHRRFLDTLTTQSEGIHYDIAAIEVDSYRRSLADLDILPRDMLPVGRVRSGQNVYAIGHPGSSFGIPDEADGRSDWTARHTLTSGLVSAVRRADDRPTVVQFDAAINGGNSGGPLFNADGDVIAVVTWSEVEVKASGDTEAMQGMSFGLATDHVLEVIRDGMSYGEVARQSELLAALGGVPSDPEQSSVYEAWATFPRLRPSIERSVRDNWGAEQAQAIRVTGIDGGFSGEYQITGASPVDLYVVVLPESPQVDVDITILDPASDSVIAQDIAVDPGDVAEVVAAGLVHGGSIGIYVQTFVAGTSVPARVAIFVFERRAGQASPPPSRPPTPPTAPPSPPAAPPAITPPGATPPSAPPTSQPSSPPPTGPITGKARTIDMKSHMADTVYASSLIGLREFDRRYLTSIAEEDAFKAIEAAFVDSTPNFAAGDPAFASDIMRASLLRSFWFPIANGMTLPHSRPLCEVHLEQVPGGSAVGVYLELDPVWRRYLPLPPGGLVSRSSDIRLVPGVASDAVRDDQANGLYRLPLELPWNDDELRTLAQPVEIPYTLVARYDDASEDRLSGRIRVNPVSQVEHAYPFGISVASIVDETHPWVRRLIDEINQRPDVRSSGTTITGAGGGPEDRLVSLALVWQDLVRRGLRYQSLTAADGIAQRCRLVHESIASGNANCLDGTVLLASFMEAVGIDSYIVLMPGHAMLGLDVGDPGDPFFVFIETTAAGVSVSGDPSTLYDDQFAALRARGSLFRAAEIDLLEGACESAARTVGQQIDQARQVLAQYRAMAGEFERRQGDPAWMARFESVLIALSQQIQIVPVSVARAHGVRPVGAPPNIDQAFRIPPRR